MSATIESDPVLTLIIGALLGGFVSVFPAFWNAVINRGFEQEKRLATLKTKVKKLMRENAANAGPQKFEDLADELDDWLNLSGYSSAKSAQKTKLQALIY